MRDHRDLILERWMWDTAKAEAWTIGEFSAMNDVLSCRGRRVVRRVVPGALLMSPPPPGGEVRGVPRGPGWETAIRVAADVGAIILFVVERHELYCTPTEAVELAHDLSLKYPDSTRPIEFALRVVRSTVGEENAPLWLKEAVTAVTSRQLRGERAR